MPRLATKVCQQPRGSHHPQVNTVLQVVNTILWANSKVTIPPTAISQALANRHIIPVFPGSMDNRISRSPPHHRTSMGNRARLCHSPPNKVHMGSQISRSLPCHNMASMGCTIRPSRTRYKASMVTKTKGFHLRHKASTASRVKISPLPHKATMGSLDSSIHRLVSSLNRTPNQGRHQAIFSLHQAQLRSSKVNIGHQAKVLTFSHHSRLLV